LKILGARLHAHRPFKAKAAVSFPHFILSAEANAGSGELTD
jgi:hypothetical protein